VLGSEHEIDEGRSALIKEYALRWKHEILDQAMSTHAYTTRKTVRSAPAYMLRVTKIPVVWYPQRTGNALRVTNFDALWVALVLRRFLAEGAGSKLGFWG
jgi:hypothetical protein